MSSTATPSPTLLPDSTGNNSDSDIDIEVAVAVTVVLALVGIVAILVVEFLLLRWKKLRSRKRGSDTDNDNPKDGDSLASNLTYGDVQARASIKAVDLASVEILITDSVYSEVSEGHPGEYTAVREGGDKVEGFFNPLTTDEMGIYSEIAGEVDEIPRLETVGESYVKMKSAGGAGASENIYSEVGKKANQEPSHGDTTADYSEIPVTIDTAGAGESEEQVNQE